MVVGGYLRQVLGEQSDRIGQRGRDTETNREQHIRTVVRELADTMGEFPHIFKWCT